MTVWTSIRRFLASPTFEGEEDEARIARLLNTILLFILAVLVVVTVPVLILIEAPWAGLLSIGFTALAMLGAWGFLRLGYLQLASWFFLTLLGLLEVGALILTGGVQSPTAAGFVVFVIVSALLLGRVGAIISGGLTILAVIGVYLAESNDVLPPSPVGLSLQLGLISIVGNVSLAALLLNLVIGSLNEALNRARQNMGELAHQRERLEETVEARTRDLARRARYLEATAAVAREATGLLDLSALLSRVVTLISERFGFYHAGIFLLDPTGTWAVLQAASSEGGQQMLARDHRLRLGMGIVGYVAEQSRPRVALDVGADAVFFDNPDLPDTHAEIALPLRARGEVIGVLDVQSKKPEAFSDEDVSVLQSLTDQVAIAINNVRLFEQVQERLEAERRAYSDLSREAWRELVKKETGLGFFSDERGTVPAGDLWRPEMQTALRTGEIARGGDHGDRLSIPIKVRDQVVGVIDGRKPDGTDWRAEEIELLKSLTEQLNVALESARLYRDTQRRAARERVTSQVTAHMRESLDVEAVLRTAVEELQQTLALEKVAIRLMTEDRYPQRVVPQEE